MENMCNSYSGPKAGKSVLTRYKVSETPEIDQSINQVLKGPEKSNIAYDGKEYASTYYLMINLNSKKYIYILILFQTIYIFEQFGGGVEHHG